MIALALLLAVVGEAALGLSQPQHFGWAFHRPLSPQLSGMLHWSGLAIVFLGLLPAIHAWGVAKGMVGWLGLLTLAACMLLLTRTYLITRKRR